MPDCEISVELLNRAMREKTASPEIPELAGSKQSWSQTRSSIRQPTAGNPQSPSRLTACANPEAEAVFAAREILKFVRAGDRFRDCAVLVRNLDDYHKPLAARFAVIEIPFFLDRRESVAHHPLAELTRSALRTVAFDWPHDDWFAALKAGFSPWTKPEIDRLENAALEFGWRGENGVNRFKSWPTRGWPDRSNGCAKKSCRRLKLSPRNWRG